MIKFFHKVSDYTIEEYIKVDSVNDMEEVLKDKIPYHVNKLYGSESIVSYYLNGDITDNNTIAIGLQMEQAESKKTIQPLETYVSMINGIIQDNRLKDLSLFIPILKRFKEEYDYDICVLVIAYNKNKQNIINFYKSSDEITLKTKVISFHKIEEEKDYLLANIILMVNIH